MEALQSYRFRTKLTEVAEGVTDAYEAYRRRRLEELARLPEEIRRLKEVAYSRPAEPMKGGRYIVIAKRGDKHYFRRSPTKPPTPPKAKTWEVMHRLTQVAGKMTLEEVAELVGGRVVDVGEYRGDPKLRGQKLILVDGQLLNKTAAILKLMKGQRFAIRETATERLVKLLRWALYLDD